MPHTFFFYSNFIFWKVLNYSIHKYTLRSIELFFEVGAPDLTPELAPFVEEDHVVDVVESPRNTVSGH